MTYIWRTGSPFGQITMASDGTALTGLWFEGQKYFAAGVAEYEEKHLPVFAETERWLSEYFAGKDPGSTPPLALEGTPFRKAVWEILLEIPFGHVTTYKAVAQGVLEKTGRRTSPRAVGGAVAHNPVSLIVPCHRVLGSGGSLTGYAGGIERKAQLIICEKAAVDRALLQS